MTLIINVPTGLYENHLVIKEFISSLSPTSPFTDVKVVFVDPCVLTPLCLTILFAAIWRWKREGIPVDMVCDTDSNCFRYLQRMDFFDLLGIPTREKFTRRNADANFSTIKIVKNAAIENLQAELTAIISKESPDLKGMANYCIGEILTNCWQHSGDYGFTCAQYFRSSGFLRISLTDIGMGIRKSFLKSQYASQISDDKEAILLSVKKNVSSKSTMPVDSNDVVTNQGIGLYFIKRIAEETGGALLIASGSSIVRFSEEEQNTESLNPWQGTSVTVCVQRDGQDWRRILGKIQNEITPERRGRIYGN